MLKLIKYLVAGYVTAFVSMGQVARAETEPGIETIIWTYADLKQLRDNAGEWKNDKGIDDFIFCYMNGKGPPRWNTGAEQVADMYTDLPEKPLPV